MTYSTINKSKFGNCSQCGAKDTDVVKIKKDLFCLLCNRLNKAKNQIEKQKEKNKLRSLVKTPNNQKLVERNIQSSALTLWFEDRMKKYYPQCDNCGAINEKLLDEKYKKQWHSCQAHLLEKRHFKSLEAHPLNGMVLGTGYSGMCNCHDEYDAGWERASKMNIWKDVVRRFKIMYPLIQPSEHRFIPDVLLKEIKK